MLIYPVDSIDQYLTIAFFSQESFMAVGTVHLIIKVKPQNLHCVVSKTLMLKTKAFFLNTDCLKIVKCTNKHPSQNRQTYRVFFFFFSFIYLFFSSVLFLIERKAIQPQDMLCFE